MTGKMALLTFTLLWVIGCCGIYFHKLNVLERIRQKEAELDRKQALLNQQLSRINQAADDALRLRDEAQKTSAEIMQVLQATRDRLKRISTQSLN